MNALSTFTRNVHAAWRPLSTELIDEGRRQGEALLQAAPSEDWLAALHREKPANQELYRDPDHGFVLLAHTELQGLFAPARPWTSLGDVCRPVGRDRNANLCPRRGSQDRCSPRPAGCNARSGRTGQVYLPGDIHDTRCLSDSALLFRFTERDLRVEDKVHHRVTRYIEQNGVWTVRPEPAARAPHDAGSMIEGSPASREAANQSAMVGIPRDRRPIAVAAVLSAMALVVLDAGMANVALPSIAKALAVAPASAVLVITAYQAALVMALLPCSALGQRLGYRRVFIAGVTLFTAASVLCSLAPTLPLLLAARFLQGLGGAAVMALGVALLRFTVPHDHLGRVISWNALTVALSTAAAPTVGALILSHASWPWLFVINFPVGCVALVASQLLPSTRPSSQQLDVPSMALNGLMFGAIVLGAEFALERPVLGWATIAVASMSLIALIRRERPKLHRSFRSTCCGRNHSGLRWSPRSCVSPVKPPGSWPCPSTSNMGSICRRSRPASI
jgi:hypothetical protein